MITPALPRQAHPARGRRSSRPSGDDREQSILITAEQLLETRAMADISVDDLAKGAGISRPTFYFYFRSKDAVLLTLVEQMIAGVDATLDRIGSAAPDPQGWREGIDASFRAFSAHRALALAGWSARGTNAEMNALWSAFMKKRIDFAAAQITAERERGAAPDTVAAPLLAASLMLMNERVMLAAFAGEQPAVPDERVVDTLTHIWLSGIYGTGR